MKILIADDDADLRALVGFTLTQAGFEVCAAPDGASALRGFAAEAPDLVVLDINMPGANGIEICRELRSRSRVPIMMLTVRDQEDDLVAALECGADDYVLKPFSPRSLLARVKALARRVEPSGSCMVAGSVRLDLEQHMLEIDGGPAIQLTPLELKALHLLMTTPGRTVTAERMLMQIWGDVSARQRRTLKQLIYRLRIKLHREGDLQSRLHTTPGAGYKLVVSPFDNPRSTDAVTADE